MDRINNLIHLIENNRKLSLILKSSMDYIALNTCFKSGILLSSKLMSIINIRRLFFVYRGDPSRCKDLFRTSMDDDETYIQVSIYKILRDFSLNGLLEVLCTVNDAPLYYIEKLRYYMSLFDISGHSDDQSKYNFRLIYSYDNCIFIFNQDTGIIDSLLLLCYLGFNFPIEFLYAYKKNNVAVKNIMCAFNYIIKKNELKNTYLSSRLIDWARQLELITGIDISKVPINDHMIKDLDNTILRFNTEYKLYLNRRYITFRFNQ